MHVVLHDGVRAEDDVELAGARLLKQARPFGFREAAGEERPLDAAGFEQPGKRVGVLAGEDFGGRHEGGLLAVGDRDEHRVECDDRLAAADVALQQAVHGAVERHVGRDFGDGRFLARRSARTATAGGCGRRFSASPAGRML